MHGHLLIILIFILIRYSLIYITSSPSSSPFLLSASSLSKRSRSYSSSRLFAVFSSSVSLGLRPISVTSKKSRIDLTAFSILNSLFFSLSSLILGRSIIFRARSLYSALLYLAHFLHSKRRCSILCFVALHHQHFCELDFLIQCR